MRIHYSPCLHKWGQPWGNQQGVMKIRASSNREPYQPEDRRAREGKSMEEDVKGKWAEQRCEISFLTLLPAPSRPQSVNCQSLPLAGLDRKLRASKHTDETPESDSTRSKAGDKREERIPLSKRKKPSLRPEPKFQFFHLPPVWFWTTNTQLPCAAVSLPIKNMK